MNLLVDAAKAAVRARGQVRGASSQALNLAVVVGHGCEVGFARAVKAALRPRTASLRLFVSGAGAQGEPGVVHAAADAVVMVAGAQAAPCADVYRAYRARRVPCCVLVPLGEGAQAQAQALVAREVACDDVVVCDAGSVAGVLGGWLLDALPDSGVALGSALACCQDAQARRIVGEAVRDNALLGALTFLKSADTPAMLACEVGMLFKLAGTYGAPLGKDRLGEVAGLAAFSLACRQAARLALRLPLPAPLVKAGVAAGGTWLAGTLAAQRLRDLSPDTEDTRKEQR